MNVFSDFFANIKKYHFLIFQMTKRDIAHRYRGSAFGFAWSILNPLLMLTVYTFVFSVVFPSRWNTDSTSGDKIDFAITLFAGLIIFNLFAEIINRAPTLILANVNYVKKVIFPLEILSLVSIGTVLFHSFISLLVLLIAQIIFKGYVPTTIIYFPVIIFPLLLLGLGISWFLSAITVYIRDISQVTGIITTILMFLSAVFFPMSALPEKYQIILKLNPLAVIIEQSRESLIFGKTPNLLLLGIIFFVGLCIAAGGLWWFQKARIGFADVL